MMNVKTCGKCLHSTNRGSVTVCSLEPENHQDVGGFIDSARTAEKCPDFQDRPGSLPSENGGLPRVTLLDREKKEI